MKSYRGEDGRWRHRLHQSWLKEAMLCPERARRTHHRKDEGWRTDAAEIGTAVHYAIESTLQLAQDEQYVRTLDETLVVARNHFTNLADHPDFRWVKYKEKSADTFLSRCIEGWHGEVLPDFLGAEYQLEVPFCIPFIDDNERVIELAGTIDYIDSHGLADWKTSGRGDYQEWEYKRFAIQPSIYSLGAFETGLLRPVDKRISFEYVVMSAKGVQRFTVERGPEHWGWLKDQVIPIAELIEYELPRWPVVDSHALCSPVWCDYWSGCKGKSLGENPWGQKV